LNPDLSVEMNDNSIGEESQPSQPDYNRPGMLHLSDRYPNCCGQRDLVQHDNPATRAPVLKQSKNKQEQVEQALNCEMNIKCIAENTIRLGFWKPETGSVANSASLAEVSRAKSNQQNPSVSNDGG
jgi:hypothetical protein